MSIFITGLIVFFGLWIMNIGRTGWFRANYGLPVAIAIEIIGIALILTQVNWD